MGSFSTSLGTSVIEIYLQIERKAQNAPAIKRPGSLRLDIRLFTHTRYIAHIFKTLNGQYTVETIYYLLLVLCQGWPCLLCYTYFESMNC